MSKAKIAVLAATVVFAVGASCAAVRVAGATFGFGLTFDEAGVADAGVPAPDAGPVVGYDG